MPLFFRFLVCFFLALAVVFPSRAETLKVAHPYSDTLRELRHRMIQVMARELTTLSPDLRLRLYPEGRLFTRNELMDGLQAGTLEMALLSRSELEQRFPGLRFDLAGPLTLDSEGLPAGPFPEETGEARALLRSGGLRWIAGLWLPCALYDRTGVCRSTPADLARAGTVFFPFKAAARHVEETSGRRVRRADTPEIAVAGLVPEIELLDSNQTLLPDGSCVALPRSAAPLYDHVALVMALPAWERLDEAQKEALDAAARVAMQYGRAALKRALEAPEDRASAVSRNGRIRVRFLSPDDLEAWAPSVPQGPSSGGASEQPTHPESPVSDSQDRSPTP